MKNEDVISNRYDTKHVIARTYRTFLSQLLACSYACLILVLMKITHKTLFFKFLSPLSFVFTVPRLFTAPRQSVVTAPSVTRLEVVYSLRPPI